MFGESLFWRNPSSVQFALQYVEADGFSEIHFFGDKTFEGGNDYEIFEDPRTIGHTVDGPEMTMRVCRELFLGAKSERGGADM